MRRRPVLFVVALVAAAAWPAPPAAAGPRLYVAPVEGVIVDHFRPPASVYAAGNRGIDEMTAPGAPVVASGAGVVIFAGAVGGTLHVTIRHADGLRTSYSFLAEVLVAEGASVEQGQTIGLSAGPFHFGVRAVDGTYLDPELLLADRLGAHLVPGADEGVAPLSSPPTAGDERLGFEQVVAAALTAVDRAASRAAAVADQARRLDPTVGLVDLTTAIARWHATQADCTAIDTAVPPPAGRRIAVLVGGLGSTSESAAVDRVDVGALGYTPADVVRFSYRGGRVGRPAGAGSFPGVPVTTYGALDTEIDLHVTADRLRDLLAAVALAAPDVPIDVIAHSQGGVVTRLALARADANGQSLTQLGAVVTLGTPHQGADLATAVAGFGPSTATGSLVAGLGELSGDALDLNGPAIAQQSQTAAVTAELAHPLPPGVHLVSIGASGDLTVPAVRTQVDGAASVIVPLTGLGAHDQLPAEPATTREIGLARAGLPPTCQGVAEGVQGLITSLAITRAEAEMGLALAGPLA